MKCSRCNHENDADADQCSACAGPLALAKLEVLRGDLPQNLFLLKPRGYALGRGRHNDIVLSEASISKSHASIEHAGGAFVVVDRGSTHGVYVDGEKVERAPLRSGCELQLGSVTLRFSLIGDSITDQVARYPWIEQQQLLLSLVQALNSTLVLSEVLEQVLDGVMRMTRAERGFILLGEDLGDEPGAPVVAGLSLRLGRLRDSDEPVREAHGISKSVVREVMRTGLAVATGDAAADPKLSHVDSIAGLELRTIVCLPLRSQRRAPGEAPQVLGALYVDNPHSSAPFRPESLSAAEALARHAALAIENARLFEREHAKSEELRLAQAKLLQSEKLAAIGRMAAGIAHELNTPLTYIIGNLELLQQAHGLPEAQREMLRSIARGAERISNLARSLLAFSRPAQEEPQSLDPNDVIERALELCHYLLLKGDVRLERRLTPGPPRVLGFSGQLELALINLFVNAVHAMDGKGTLSVSSHCIDGAVQIEVADTGPGIPDEIRATLFDPFVTTKPPGRGTGLGLASVLAAVEAHHGKVDFETATGAGTTFRITLPAVPV